MVLFRTVSSLLLLIATAIVPAKIFPAEAAPISISIHAFPNDVEIRNPWQKAIFTRNNDGTFRMTTFVRKANEWQPLFDGQRPLVQGPGFDLRPTEYRVVENTAQRAAIELNGVQKREGYPWKLLVETKAGSKFLRFRVTCQLDKMLILSALEPQFALWINQPAVAVSVNQGPGNIYQGAEEKEWGNSFPAAYLWDNDREAAIFYDMSPMAWMSHRNLFRFRDCRVQAFSEGNQTGFGLRVVKRNFHEIPAGEVVFDAYLYSAARAGEPTRLDALDRLIQICAPLHSSQAALPENRIAPHRTNWETFARGVANNLMLEDVVWKDILLPADRPWQDLPAFPEDRVNRLRVSADYAVDSACEPQWNRKNVVQSWDFSTCNNYLSAWIAYNRLRPDPKQQDFLAAKVASLPLFFDPKAGLIRHSTRYPLHVGDKEMVWQNLMFALETVKVYQMLPQEAFKPAVSGKFLQGIDSLIQLARNNNYILPQWFDPYQKTALMQGDVPELGIIYEPWQIGTYAYLLGEAYKITGDAKYLREARTAIDRLFGGMKFTVTNKRYTREYTDPVDFPITEIFGNAWGVAAASCLHRWTGDRKYLRYSDYFLDSLLRMTYWYESRLRDDPRDRALQNAGLFRNHSGAYTGSPWETGEAYLALTLRLKHDPKPREPLLRLFNLQRVNSFFFFPPVFPPEAAPCKKLMEHAANYLPIEDAYTNEHGGANGAMGRSIYMSGIAFWNYLLYEAFAVAEPPEWMVLNLDIREGFDSAVSAVERHFLIYNGSETRRKGHVRMRAVAEGKYRLRLRRETAKVDERTLSASNLRKGIKLDLQPDAYVRVEMKRLESGESVKKLTQAQRARNRISSAYLRLQQTAAKGISQNTLSESKRLFRKAEAAYRAEKFAQAAELAAHVQPKPASR